MNHHQIEELRTALRMAIDYLMNRHEADEIFMHTIRDVLQRTAPASVQDIPDDRYLEIDLDRPAEASEVREIEDDEIPF
jgi:hypothetical protein